MSWILKPIFYFIIDFLGLRVQKKNKENIEKTNMNSGRLLNETSGWSGEICKMIERERLPHTRLETNPSTNIIIIIIFFSILKIRG